MTISPKGVALWNDAHCRLDLTEQRIAELPIELGQLQAVAEMVRPRLRFDAEPANFRVEMLRFARGTR
jgi:hypothetical protein